MLKMSSTIKVTYQIDFKKLLQTRTVVTKGSDLEQDSIQSAQLFSEALYSCIRVCSVPSFPQAVISGHKLVTAQFL